MIAVASGTPVSITGLGCHVPARVVTNDDLAKLVDTSDEWIGPRTGFASGVTPPTTRRSRTSRCRRQRLALERAEVKGPTSTC
jgi:3-oxoacyl-[acyl-carrier-protein] synthase-3